MDNKRNRPLEIYRFILCFWPLYHHNFFFLERDYSRFTVANLAVDFFYVLSGFFLLKSMEKRKGEGIILGSVKVVYDRVKPMLFSIAYITSFSLLCILLFIREDHLKVAFEVVKYWWFILYLLIAVAIFYLLYRVVKNKWAYLFTMFLVSLGMLIFHFAVEKRGFLIPELTFPARTIGCIALGVMVSYIPKFKTKRFNLNIIAALLLFLSLLCAAYREKSYGVCILMIVMFAALVYFSSNISVSGRVFDLAGKLSTRIYLYMAFVTVIYYLGITNHRMLFVIDVFLAVLDMVLTNYREKYLALKRKVEE